MNLPVSQPKPAAQPSFDLAYYERIWHMVREWKTLGEIPADRIPSREVIDAVTRLLYLEARLLDQRRLREWLALFANDGAYWIPADIDIRDPRTTVSWEFNDRRRLEERIERLETSRAYSQMPPTRTVHALSNIEVMTAESASVNVLCNFQIQTRRGGDTTPRCGWCGYVLRHEANGWRIVLKRVNLFDADLPQSNLSFTL